MLNILAFTAGACLWLALMVFIWFRNEPWGAALTVVLLMIALLWAIPMYILLSGGLLYL